MLNTRDRPASLSSDDRDRQLNQLVIHRLCKTYPNGTRALDNLSLRLENGLFGLLGPNGAGKSSLMKALATLHVADSGSIHFNGVDIQSNPQQMRRSLGYLPQEFGVYPRVSAVRLLDHLAVLKGVHGKQQRREQIEHVLAVTNLIEHRNAAVADYSGGMRQRFGIAQALLGSPRVLVIDEPTAGLDPAERNRLHALLCSIAQDMIVLLSTHIVEDVANLCPRLAILSRGRLCFQGSPAELSAPLDNRFWCKTIEASELEACKHRFQRFSIRTRAGAHQVRVVSEQQPGADFVPTHADLEDAYFYTLAQDEHV